MVVFNGNAEAKGYAARLDVTVKSQNAGNNTSVVNAKLYIRRVSGYNRFEQWDIWYQLNINGTVINHSSRPNMNPTSEVLVMNNDFTITHDALGKKTISVYGHFDGKNQASYVPGFASVSGTMALPDLIQHKVANFTLSTSNIVVESPFTITLSNHDQSRYRYHLYYEDGSGQTGLSGNTVSGGSHTLDSSWIDRAPLSGRLRLYTLYNGNVIGSNTVNVTVSKPSGSSAPTIDSVVITEANTRIGTLLGTKRFLQYLSRIQVTVNATGSYGSSIRSYSVSIGQTYSNSKTTIFENIKESGSIVIYIYVEDGRGKYVSRQETINVLPYGYPTSNITPRRASSAATNVTISSITTVASVKNASNQELNNQTITYSYRELGTSNWVGAWNYITNDARLSINGSTPFKTGRNNTVFDKNKVYEIQAIVTDRFGGRSISVQLVGGEVVTLAYHHDGVGVGKVRVHNQRTLDVAKGGISTDGLYYRNGNLLIQNTMLSTENGTCMATTSGVDTITHTGYWMIDPTLSVNATKLPFTTSTYFMLHVMCLSNSIVFQQLVDPGTSAIYTRTRNGNTWTPWDTMINMTTALLMIQNQQVHTREFSFPYGLAGAITRVGQLVTVTINRQAKSLTNKHEDAVAAEVIPTGFRPNVDVYLPIYVNNQTNIRPTNFLHLKRDGSIMINYGTIGHNIYTGSTTYITTDPMPSNGQF